MSKDKYISIGKFAGTHGLKGDLVLKHGLGKKTSLEGVTSLFIADKGGNYLPWFVETSRIKDEANLFVKLEGIDTKEDARPLLQKEVWLSEADFKKHAAKTSTISLLGHTVFEGDRELGAVAEVIEQPHQILCRIDMEGKEVFIPLHEETLVKIDQKQKKIFVALPEGLLDIYLT